MVDSYGRNIDYIRISVTDRCNLRCTYCMPEEGLQMTTHEELLTFDEITRVCSIMAQMGLKKIKLTGGEPLVRRDLERLVKSLKEIEGIEKVTITTNGVLLADKIDALCEAGLDAVNISLDTMDPELYEIITRRNELPHAVEGIKAAIAHPELTVKINCVPLSEESQDFFALLEFARQYNVHVRFIEMMPIGLGKNRQGQREDELMARIVKRYGRAEIFEGKLGNGPCHYYSIAGFKGKVGFISAISHQFCDRCNRIRLTSQGFLKTCLQYESGGELKPLLRGNASDIELRRAIAEIIYNKPKAHSFYRCQIENENIMCMSQIGG